MRITLIPDRIIIIDDEALLKVQEDLSWIPENIHALQWYDTWGEIEYKDNTPNELVENLGIYEQVIDTFNNEKTRIQNEKVLREQQVEASRDYWEELRMIRNHLLFNSDWTQIPDSPLTSTKKAEWQVYRQALRDLTNNIVDPKPLVLDLTNSSWPIPPSL